MAFVLALGPAPSTAEDINCCVKPYSYFNCEGDGHLASPGKLYTCVDTSELKGCMSCLRDEEYSEGTCSTCCAIESDSECNSPESEWEFIASALFFICLCCCFTALCGFTEIRRKKKGISFAEAWSVPQGMPILQTWPRRSVSASDVNQVGVDGEGQQWASLADGEDDPKRYPVAGLVDDSGMAFGFVSSLPQSILTSVATSLGQSGSAAPPSPQEPELTVWIARDDVGALGTVETRRPQQDSSSRSTPLGQAGGRHQRAVVVGNDLEEPLVVEGAGPTRGTSLLGRTRSISSSSTTGPNG
eukprot:g5730.t1